MIIWLLLRKLHSFPDESELADDGKKLTTNIQPVIRFDISENWNLITQTIMPVSLQDGAGYWAESPDAGPEGFRFRLQANIVLPK